MKTCLQNDSEQKKRFLLQQDKQEGAAKNSRKSGSSTIRVQNLLPQPPKKEKKMKKGSEVPTNSRTHLHHYVLLIIIIIITVPVLKSVCMLVSPSSGSWENSHTVTSDPLGSGQSLSPWKRHQSHHVKVSLPHGKSAASQSPAPPAAVSSCVGRGRVFFQWSERLVG